MSDSSIRYGAQVAVNQNESRGTKGGNLKPITKESHDTREDTANESQAVADESRRLKGSKYSEIHVRQISDERLDTAVRGFIYLPLSYMLVVVDHANMKLKAFNTSDQCVSSATLRAETWGITLVNDNSFATCGLRNKVYLWVVDGKKQIKKQKSYKVEYNAYGIHFNGTYYCVLHRYDNAIAVLDSQGRKVKMRILKEAFGEKVIFGWDIHMDKDTHNIYVPCDRRSGVMCLTIDGHPLWFTKLKYPKGITEIGGTLCVAENSPESLRLISKEGEYKQVLLDQDVLDGIPFYIHFAQNRKLYVSFHGSINYVQRSHLIFAFTISEQ